MRAFTLLNRPPSSSAPVSSTPSAPVVEIPANLPTEGTWPPNVVFVDSAGRDWIFDGNAWRQTGQSGTPLTDPQIQSVISGYLSQVSAGEAAQAALAAQVAAGETPQVTPSSNSGEMLIILIGAAIVLIILFYRGIL